MTQPFQPPQLPTTGPTAPPTPTPGGAGPGMGVSAQELAVVSGILGDLFKAAVPELVKVFRNAISSLGPAAADAATVAQEYDRVQTEISSWLTGILGKVIQVGGELLLGAVSGQAAGGAGTQGTGKRLLNEIAKIKSDSEGKGVAFEGKGFIKEKSEKLEKSEVVEKSPVPEKGIKEGEAGGAGTQSAGKGFLKDVKPEKEISNEILKFKSDKEGPKEFKSDKEGKAEGLEKVKYEAEKALKGEIEKPFEKPQVPEKGIKEGEASQPAQVAGPLSLDRETLCRHAEALEGLGRDLRHFIERSERPDLTHGALHEEPDQQGNPRAGT